MQTVCDSENEFDEEIRKRHYICPVCKKPFTLPMYVSLSSYVYVVSVYDKDKKKTFQKKCCSYSCYRKGSKE